MLEAANTQADRAAMGVTTSLFFAILGGLLAWCAWLVVHGRAWARSPIIVAQVIFLGLAYNFLGGSTTWVALALGLVARSCWSACSTRRASRRSPATTTTPDRRDGLAGLLQRGAQLLEGPAQQP